ncbi:MAG: hypothetical protein ACREYF_10670 [Gammaproteobacteria bacterium]
MNTKTLKGLGTAVSLLLAASPALATSTGLQTLGAPANSIDVFTFTCPAGFIGAAARVDDREPPINPALMQVVLSKDGFPTVQQTAPDDAGGSSAFATVLDGSGLYAVVFKKTNVGIEAYIGDVFCVQPAVPLNILQNVVGLKRQINQ